ncbi:tRNA pseudouridine(55) synthase TruB [Candidatus Fermentibacteria bacterium]|nr:tRNA pseudouridine(55) synthase TruB [Candidatus Fermentibacteria bacterium]
MDGIISIRKPRGPTSHDVVRAVRRLVPGTKVGHAGTLDPAADGVVVVCLGAYTRLAALFQATPKEYEGVVLFGRSTDTLDLQGRTILRCYVPEDLPQRVAAALPAFCGGYLQEVPRYSAAKHGGVAFHRLVRKGMETPLRRKWVELHRAEVLPDCRSRRRIRFKLVTGSGFYVRAWAKDLGDALGIPALLARLTRTRVGSYRMETSVALEELERGSLARHILRDAAAIPWVPVVNADDDAFDRLCHGQAQELPGERCGETAAVVNESGCLGLIAHAQGSVLQPWIVLKTTGLAP